MTLLVKEVDTLGVAEGDFDDVPQLLGDEDTEVVSVTLLHLVTVLETLPHPLGEVETESVILPEGEGVEVPQVLEVGVALLQRVVVPLPE